MRIWVTGIGVMSPLGRGAEATMKRLIAGDRAFGPVTLFDASGSKSRIAAEVPGVAAADVAAAHMKDVETQGKYGVDYKSYWVDEENGRIFCLVEAPDAETAHRVHHEAHGLVADEIYEVQQGS